MQQGVITINTRYSYLVVFSVAIILRLIPELIAFPYPIGYDVINYYIPVMENFDTYWTTISNQFPLYVSLLYIISEVFSLDSRIVITSSIILVFGLFSTVIFSVGRSLLHLNNLQSIFLSLFVVFQFAVLRTSWDLHKDMFALTLSFFCLLYLSKIPKISKKMTIVITSMSIISVFADRMIGLLLSATLILSYFVNRNKVFGIVAIFVFLIFGLLLLANINIQSNLELLDDSNTINEIYTPVNLAIMFLVLNAILIPSGIIGFVKTKLIIFKIPLLISLIGSLTWVVFPNTSALLPDRWIVIFSIFLSLFSGYGFVTIIENRYFAISKKKFNNYLIILIPFMFLGLTFAASPDHSYLNIYGAFHQFISPYGPSTMQYNSISLPESRSLLSVIDWINNNADVPDGLLIVGNKHLRGWIELELKGGTFLFHDNNTILLESNNYSNFYLLELKSRQLTKIPENYSQELSYNNTDFSLYHLKRIQQE